MAWENEARLICMLTPLVEGGEKGCFLLSTVSRSHKHLVGEGRVKCHQYWPSDPETPVEFGQFV